MNKITYNKLIRDKIPEIIRARGAECEVETIDDARFKEEIMRKVIEEASGLQEAATREDLLEELGDVMVVLDEICKLHNIDPEEMRKAKERNLELKGGFSERVYLHWSSDDQYSPKDRVR